MRERLYKAVVDKNVFIIEDILQEITEDGDHPNEDGEYIEKGYAYFLRLDIIKAQLCLSEYLKWKTQVREWNSKNAKSGFKKFLVKEKEKIKR